MAASFQLGYGILDLDYYDFDPTSQTSYLTIGNAFTKVAVAEREILVTNVKIDSTIFSPRFIKMSLSGTSYKGTYEITETDTTITRYELEITNANLVKFNKSTYTK